MIKTTYMVTTRVDQERGLMSIDCEESLWDDLEDAMSDACSNAQKNGIDYYVIQTEVLSKVSQGAAKVTKV